MGGFTIGRLAAAADASVETIRYYERIGLLLRPERSGANYRLYDSAALKRLHFIRRARALGFSLDQIQDLLDLAQERQRPCNEIDRVARVHLSGLERRIADLTALRDELASMLDRCDRTVVADCRVIGALAQPLDARNAAS